MARYSEEQRFLPHKLLEGDDYPETNSIKSDHDSQKMMAFSAPPILFDIENRFYEDFLEEITQSDPQLDKFGIIRSFNKKSEDNIPIQSNYRKQQERQHRLSLQTEEYHSYYSVNIPNLKSYMTSPQQEIMNNLSKASRWARDQYGSRTVQMIIQNGQSYTKDAIFESLIEECMELTKDKFGNYVFQKIFERGDQKHKQRLFQNIKLHIFEYCENCYGCRVVQRAIEYTVGKPKLQSQIIGLIQPYSLYLIENINGNHVMQKCFEVIDLQLLQNISKVIIQNLQKLSLHAYGCRVIQKYLEKLQLQINHKEQELKRLQSKQLNKEAQLREIQSKQRLMFDKLLQISVELSQCQYGNYVMQHIVSNSKEYKTQIQQIFLNNFTQLSSNKYASNVIQKIIKLALPEYRQKLAKILYQSEHLVWLTKHQYGNYVVQSLLQKISIQMRNNLRSKIRENSQQISKSQYGRHVLVQMDKIK